MTTTASPLDVYGEDLLTLVSGSPARTWLRYEDGGAALLDLPKWTGPTDPVDDELLARCTAPTLDLGCGPGRLTRGLVARGTDCLGVDLAPVAIGLARSGGTPVLHASAFDRVLDDTRWGTVLLAAGNVGIDGDPVALLARCRSLLAPDGRVLVELDPPAVRTRSVRVRVESCSGSTSSWFSWAHLSAADVAEVARAAGLECCGVWVQSGRWFAALRRPATS